MPQESRHAVLSPYLFDAGGLANPHIVVKESEHSTDATDYLRRGWEPRPVVQMIDNGILTFSDAKKKKQFLSVKNQTASKFFRRIS